MNARDENRGFIQAFVLGTVLSIVVGMLANVLLADAFGSPRSILLFAVVVAISAVIILHRLGYTNRATAFGIGCMFGFFMALWVLDAKLEDIGNIIVADPTPPVVIPTDTPPSDDDDTIFAQELVNARALEAVNIRIGASTLHSVVGFLRQGEIVRIIGVSPDRTWWKIACPSGLGPECWITAREMYIKIESGDPSTMPVVVPPAVPEVPSIDAVQPTPTPLPPQPEPTFPAPPTPVPNPPMPTDMPDPPTPVPPTRQPPTEPPTAIPCEDGTRNHGGRCTPTPRSDKTPEPTRIPVTPTRTRP